LILSFCPLIGKKCVEAKCKFWTHLLGKNPQGDGVVDKFGCAIEFLPILLVENAQMIRQTVASTDKVANQVQKSRAEFIGALPQNAQKRLLDADPQVRQIGRTGE
jgi:hypothetical protein